MSPYKYPVSNMPPAFQSYTPRFMKVYGAICVNNSGDVLLVRGRTSKKWSFPKGHCKAHENDIECALRELREETGLVIGTQKYTSCHKLRGATYFVFAIEGNPIIKTEDHREIEEVAWWPLVKLPRLGSNVDVSIFRTFMKTITSDNNNFIAFIDSPEARKKIGNITNNILDSRPCFTNTIS